PVVAAQRVQRSQVLWARRAGGANAATGLQALTAGDVPARTTLLSQPDREQLREQPVPARRVARLGRCACVFVDARRAPTSATAIGTHEQRRVSQPFELGEGDRAMDTLPG